MKVIVTWLACLLFVTSGYTQMSQVHCWTGHIHSSIPVFIWLVEKDSVFKGEVVYTRTKDKRPITLLGQRYPGGDGRHIRICEYLPDATISGVYDFDQLTAAVAGTWFSPATQKEFNVVLVSKDTVLPDIDTNFQSGPEEGAYAYAYGRKGPGGSININRVNAHRISFEIGCNTGAPAVNLANIDRDTVSLTGDYFDYKLPGSEHCVFRVHFYKHFLIISYLDGADCLFGAGATIEGIFYKSPSEK